MSNSGDLVLISMLDTDTDQVAAFEELIGSHGGLGGPQNEPLLLYPTDWELDTEPLVGAPAVHAQLMRWLGQPDSKPTAKAADKPAKPTKSTTGRAGDEPRSPRRWLHVVIKADATFLGHSTVLIEIGDARILTDPVLIDRVTILRRAVGTLPADLYQGIDAVVISHLHLDHLDVASLRLLGSDMQLIVPRGAGRLLERAGFRNVVELGRGKSVDRRRRAGDRDASRPFGLSAAIRSERRGRRLRVRGGRRERLFRRGHGHLRRDGGPVGRRPRACCRCGAGGRGWVPGTWIRSAPQMRSRC